MAVSSSQSTLRHYSTFLQIVPVQHSTERHQELIEHSIRSMSLDFEYPPCLSRSLAILHRTD